MNDKVSPKGERMPWATFIYKYSVVFKYIITIFKLHQRNKGVE